MIKCTNCKWEGKHAKGPLNHCPVCGDDTDATDYYKPEFVIPNKEESKPVKKEINYDLNNDGVIDDKDASIAAKVMNRVRYKSKNKGKRR